MSRRRWRAAEIDQLGRHYAEDGLNLLTASLGRSPDAITSQARRLGLRSPQRHRRQAQGRAANNKSVNTRFFDTLTEQVAFVLGYIWARGHLKTNPPHVLRLRCPTAKEKDLLAVRDLLGSRHRVQRAKGATLCEVCSSWLLQTLIRHYGSPPSRANPAPPLPPVPTEFLPHLAKGLLAGSGYVDQHSISWTGPPMMLTELQEKIRDATGVGCPTVGEKGRCRTITWTAPHQVQLLRRWLTPQG
jgi:hypothetical protein